MILELFNDNDDYLLLRNGLILTQQLVDETQFKWVLHDGIHKYEDPLYICQRLAPILGLDDDYPKDVPCLPLDVKAVVLTDGDRHISLVGSLSLHCHSYPEKRLAFGLMVSDPAFYRKAVIEGIILARIDPSEIVETVDGKSIDDQIKKLLAIVFERATDGFPNLEPSTVETAIEQFIEYGRKDLRNLRGAILTSGDDEYEDDNTIILRLIDHGKIFHLRVSDRKTDVIL